MSSRFYRPLEEEGQDEDRPPFQDPISAYDTPQETPDSPFQSPPSVAATKATKPDVNPFDEVDPRIKELDDQIRSQPRSIGGIVAAFSPHGDKRLASLMAQRHLYGQEAHGNMALRSSMARQLASSEARAQAAETAARARMYASDQSLQRGLGVAGINAGSREAVAITRNEKPFNVPAGGSVYTPATGEMGPQTGFKPTVERPGAAPKPVKPPVDPLVAQKAKEIQVAISAYDKALLKDQTGEAPLDDNKRHLLQTRKEMAQLDLDQLYKKGGSGQQPSAAPSTAPGVAQSKAASRPTATGPNGEKVEWNGTAWVPAS